MRILVRFGELALKSKPVRRLFLNILARNTRLMLKNKGVDAKVKRERSRIFVDTEDYPKAKKVLQCVFGITSFSPVVSCSSNEDEIAAEAKKYSKDKITKKHKFSVRARRPWKGFPRTSLQMQSKVGKIVENATGASVDLKNPDKTLFLEIREEGTYLFMEKIRGLGGMPVGTGGKFLSLISDSNSILAAWFMMKRGCVPVCVSPRKSRPKNLKILEEYSPGPIKFYQSSAKSLGRIIKKERTPVICTGTAEINLKLPLPTLQPLIGFDNSAIEMFKKELALDKER